MTSQDQREADLIAAGWPVDAAGQRMAVHGAIEAARILARAKKIAEDRQRR